MGQKRRDPVGARELVERSHIGRIDGLGLAAARLRVKNWNVFPSMEAASWAIFRYPLALDK